MGKGFSDQTAADNLRLRAEERARELAPPLPDSLPLSPDEGQRVLHNLRVHQIELELQNEELRHSQVELETLWHRFLDLYETAPAGYLTVDDHGLILASNLSAATLLGVPRSALIRRALNRFIHPDDQDLYYRKRLQLNLETEALAPWDMRMVRGNGDSFWGNLSVRSVVGPDEAGETRIILADVTARVRADRAQEFLARADWVNTQESFFEVLVRFLAQELALEHVCIARLAEDGLTAEPLATWADGRLEPNVPYALDGTPSADIVGRIIHCIPRGVREQFPQDQRLQNMEAESYVGVTLWGANKQPIGLISLIGRHPVLAPGEAKITLHLVALRAAAELEHHQAALEKGQLLTRLLQAQKLESLGLLAGGIAHDMNNVLGAILGLASAHLGHQPPDSPLHRALDTICKASERGGAMVKALLGFARQSPAESVRVEMNRLVTEQLRLLERTALAQMQLKLDLEPDLHPIGGDPSALATALMNLCINAVEAMPQQGTLTLHTRNVGPHWIEVEVQDSGIGMSQAVLDKAMDPFFTTKGIGRGTGLGLSLAFRTVQVHGGQLSILSEPGQGTRVILRLPAGPCHGREAQECVVDAPGALARSLRVLLVDDDDLVQVAVQILLEALGHREVTLAPSGETALAQLEAGLQPDLIILDMNMPGLGGAGTLPRLRALRPHVPIFLATGRADQSTIDLAEAYPGVSILPKPFGLKGLQQHLRKFGPG